MEEKRLSIGEDLKLMCYNSKFKDSVETRVLNIVEEEDFLGENFDLMIEGKHPKSSWIFNIYLSEDSSVLVELNTESDERNIIGKDIEVINNV